MAEIEDRLQCLAAEEASLVFDEFTQEDAVAIGLKIYEKAREKGKSIALHISINRRDVFHLSMDGCAPDNDIWLRKKENMVYRFLQSSFRTVTFCEMMDTNVFAFYSIDPNKYVGAAGGFPIAVKGAGCVGAICTGGQMPPQDHQLIVDVLKEYLKK